MNINSQSKNNNITNNTINNKCSKCGQCCGLFIPFKREEIQPIKDYVKKYNIKPINRLFKGQIKAHCPFYNEKEHVCNIYEVRPYVCRDFICSRENWKERRSYYSKIADFNGVEAYNTQLVSFDDVIYNDFSLVLAYILSLLTTENINEDDAVVKIFIGTRRLELLKLFSCVTDKGETLEGTQLLERYIHNKYTFEEYIKLHPELVLNI